MANAALGALILLVLPKETHSWTALATLAWVVLAGGITARVIARAGGDRAYPWFLVATSVHAWLAMYFCAPAWGLMAVWPTGNHLTMLSPVTLPPVLQTLWSGGKHLPTLQPRKLLLTISLIAVGHLLYFYAHISAATRLFLICLGVVSFLAARRVRRAASLTRSDGACPGSA